MPGVNGAEGDGRGAAARLGHKGQNTRARRGTDGDRGGNSRGNTGREGAPPQSCGGAEGGRIPAALPTPPFPFPLHPRRSPQPLWVSPDAPPSLLLSGSIPAPFARVAGIPSRRAPLAVSPRSVRAAPGPGAPPGRGSRLQGCGQPLAGAAGPRSAQ